MGLKFATRVFLIALGGTGLLPAQVTILAAGSPPVWTLSNARVKAQFEFTADGRFIWKSLTDNLGGRTWAADPIYGSSPVDLHTSAGYLQSETTWRLLAWNERLVRGGRRLTVQLADTLGRGTATVEIEMYAGQNILRHRVRWRNGLGRTLYVRNVDPLNYRFLDSGESYRAFYVNQWMGGGKFGNFETQEVEVAKGEPGVRIESGSYGRHCGWLAFRDSDDNGLVAGWEFDGRADVTLRHDAGPRLLWLEAVVPGLNKALQQGEELASPWAFLGVFKGDWDEASWRTTRFVENVLAKSVPDEENFPYVVWDSWKYQTAIHEEILKENARMAAQLGIELFIVDLGWARQIGEWDPDPEKFPSGFRALSDYVHSLGMKFGLHVAFAEANDSSPVLKENPDWGSSVNYGYFGARSLCLGHEPVRKWVTEELIRLIDVYNVDWILQDGENMVKVCTKTTHTHDPENSNWANSVEGLNALVEEVQRRRPQVLWENCEDGGNMMTFNMVKNYVTSITCDDSGDRVTRKAGYGALYPFPPRYTDRYMPHDDELTLYTTRSYMFGGPWIFMNRLPKMNSEKLALAKREIEIYKKNRRAIAEGRTYHLTGEPGEDRYDVLQSLHPETGASIVVIVRDGISPPAFHLKPRGLAAGRVYEITFEDRPDVFTMTGRQLMTQGLAVPFETSWTGEIVYISPQ